LILGLALMAGAAAKPDTAWTTVFDSGDDDDISDMAVLPGGGCVLGCWAAEGYGFQSDVYFIKVKP